MSFDVLITGRLVKAPERRTAKNGNAFAVASVAVPTEADESMLASVIAFRSEAVAALLALGKGDAVALAGKAKLNSWTGSDGTAKHGLSVTVDVVTSVYHVRRKRAAVQGDDGEPAPTAPARQPREQRQPREPDFDGADSAF